VCLTVTITNMASGATVFTFEHQWGHFLDELVLGEVHPTQMLANFVKMVDHCRDTFVQETVPPDWLKEEAQQQAVTKSVP
jgi:hypothetical protein